MCKGGEGRKSCGMRDRRIGTGRRERYQGLYIDSYDMVVLL